MDLFDDLLSETSSARVRPGARFAPKAKSKHQPQKNVSASQDVNNVNVASSSPTHNNDNELNNVEVIHNSLQDTLNAGFKNDSGDSNTAALSESNIHSNFDSGEVGKGLLSEEIELDPFSNVLPDSGTGNAHKFKPKIKPRPRVGKTSANTSASSSVMMEKSGITLSEDSRSLEEVIPSQPDSLNVMPSEALVDNGTRDWPSNFGKSTAETAEIFSELEVLDDFLNEAATGTDLNSFNMKGAEENFVLPEYDNKSRSETQAGADLNPDCPIDNVYDYQTMKSGTDPTFEIPMHDGLANSTDSPTLADSLQQDGIGEKEDTSERKKSPKKHKRSSVAAGMEDKSGKTSRQPRKQSARKPAKNSPLNEAIVDDDDPDPSYDANRDELEENDEEDGVDYLSKKKKASTRPRKKSVAKNGKTSEKRKKTNDDLENITKEPPKKFSHSSRRKKRCVDKALLDDEELDHRTIPIRDVILLADYRERLAKKEAITSKTSSTNESMRGFLNEDDANNEDENFGSDDGSRDLDDDQANEKITSTNPLINYQSFMDKAPRGKWSKQDTEVFYEAVRQFGTDFSMIQQLFHDKTRHQIKLKYKKEERQHPLQLYDALNNRATDLSFFQKVIEKQKQTSNKAEQDVRDASDFMPEDEVEDPPPGTKEEVTTTEQDLIDVKDQDGSTAFQNPEQSDDSDDDDLEKWSHYQSAV
ncbi:uncharacterized protein [Cicer arietinum]|uniref:Transcription factor TFIIIB component B'' isoform X2 n=1 Tax=Cicer arietinum TaxID=3827 RepID=A0A1S3EB75_CICAR|nr:transcription factor TFIIIB component B'' isoform X2 [Cicer arietinum]